MSEQPAGGAGGADGQVGGPPSLLAISVAIPEPSAAELGLLVQRQQRRLSDARATAPSADWWCCHGMVSRLVVPTPVACISTVASFLFYGMRQLSDRNLNPLVKFTAPG